MFDKLVELLARVLVAGKQVHDANLVATMLAYGVARLLTFMGGRKHASPAPADDDDDDSDYEDDGGILDWERIGRRALAKSRRVPAMDFMCVSYLIKRVLPLR